MKIEQGSASLSDLKQVVSLQFTDIKLTVTQGQGSLVRAFMFYKTTFSQFNSEVKAVRGQNFFCLLGKFLRAESSGWMHSRSSVFLMVIFFFKHLSSSILKLSSKSELQTQIFSLNLTETPPPPQTPRLTVFFVSMNQNCSVWALGVGLDTGGSETVQEMEREDVSLVSG